MLWGTAGAGNASRIAPGSAGPAPGRRTEGRTGWAHGRILRNGKLLGV